MSSTKIGSIRSQIDTAEKARGVARSSALGELVKDLESDRGCDAAKVDLLKKALQSLQSPNAV